MLFEGMPILSEDCSDKDLIDVKDYVHFASFFDLGTTAKTILTSPPKQMTLQEKQKLQASRNQQLHSVRKKILELMQSS